MNQLEILKMIESGEITVDQGMELLNKLKDEKIEVSNVVDTIDIDAKASNDAIAVENQEVKLSSSEYSGNNNKEQVIDFDDTDREQERDYNNSIENKDRYSKTDIDESVTEIEVDGIRMIEVKLVSPERVFIQKSNREKMMLKIKSNDDGGVIKINTYGDNIQIEEEVMDMKRLFKIFKPASYQIFIDIPSEFCDVLKVRTVSGNIIIDVDNLKKATIATTSGDISGIKLCADGIDIKSVSGDYDVDLTEGRISFNNTSGDLKTYMPSLKGENVFKTVSGDIDLTLNENQGFNVDFKTVSGDVKSIFPIETFGSISTKSFKGKFGNPDGDIILKSVSGDLNIRKK